MRPAAPAALTIWLLAACTPMRSPVATCADSVHGAWTAPGGATWMLLDRGATVEGYPLFDDAVAGGAPRALELRRDGPRHDGPLAGTVTRRFSRGDRHCEATAPVRVRACTRRTLQVEIAEPPPPLAFSPCAWGRPAPGRVETWSRH